MPKYVLISLALMLALTIATLQTPTSAQEPHSLTIQDSVEASNVADWVRDLEPVASENSHAQLLGGLNFMTLNHESRDWIAQNGVEVFYADPQNIQRAQQSVQIRASAFGATAPLGGMYYFRDVQNFPWGMIEIAPGQYDFSLSDYLVSQTEAQGMRYVGTVMPFADWDLAQNGPTEAICEHFFAEDYFYLASTGAMGRYNDLDAFLTWLAIMVERYDGDGVEDMPGLQYGVKYWQIHNEPEGENCGQFRRDPEAFVELMQRGYEVVHASCADCFVINGGAGSQVWQANNNLAGFWETYAELGGSDAIDIIAIHYNNGKHEQGNGKPADFEFMIQYFHDLFGADKPVWVTEFGVLIGESTPDGRFIGIPEAEAGAWFIRFYTAGLANGVDHFYSDSFAFIFVEPQHQAITLRLPYYVNILVEHMVGSATESEKLAEGQYHFTVDGQSVYVLWAGVPAEITGNVLVTDMYGNQTTLSAQDIQPSETNPIFVQETD